MSGVMYYCEMIEITEEKYKLEWHSMGCTVYTVYTVYCAAHSRYCIFSSSTKLRFCKGRSAQIKKCKKID